MDILDYKPSQRHILITKADETYVVDRHTQKGYLLGELNDQYSEHSVDFSKLVAYDAFSIKESNYSKPPSASNPLLMTTKTLGRPGSEPLRAVFTSNTYPVWTSKTDCWSYLHFTHPNWFPYGVVNDKTDPPPVRAKVKC